MIAALSKLLQSCKGAAAIEYALIVALVVIASIGALTAFAGTTVGMWNDVSTKVQSAG